MRLFAIGLALFVSVVAPLCAEEKPDPTVPEGTTVQLILLRQKSVQEELKVEKELARLIHEFTVMEHKEYKKALKLPGESQGAKFKDLEKTNRAFLEEKLTPEQRKRLGQITMQVTGLMQLTRPEVAEKLELTQEQKDTVKKMFNEAAKTLREIVDGEKVTNRNERLAEHRANIYAKIVELLSEKQKGIAREYIGERFKGAILIEEESDDKDK